MTQATVSADGETITVHIPLTFRKRGGRKLVVMPDGAEWAPRPRVDSAMVKALARAFRWRKMLDEGVHATLEDLARAKGVHATYVSRVLRLTLLAPNIVEAIVDGRQPAGLQLDHLLEGFPLGWAAQRRSLAIHAFKSHECDAAPSLPRAHETILARSLGAGSEGAMDHPLLPILAYTEAGGTTAGDWDGPDKINL